MNYAKHLLNISLITAAGTVGLVGCSSGPKVQDFANTASASEEIQKLESDLASAKSNQVDVLAPENYSAAQEALKDAKKTAEKGKDKNALHEVAVGQAYLAKANAAAEVGRNTAGEVAAARQAAIAAGAEKHKPNELKEIDSDFREVTKDVEDGKTKSLVKNREKLQAAYLKLELETIRQASLGGPRSVVDLARKEGGKEWAARSLAVAEKELNDADAYVTGNRHDAAGIATRAASTQAAADKALKIVREAKFAKKASPEEIALRLDNENTLKEKSQSQLAAEQKQTAALSATTKRLKNEEEFNKRYEEARTVFSEEEALVYKQGDKLVVRLKQLNFPSARASLSQSNFPLLAKVQKVITSMGPSAVVVEGHTDSIGGKAKNEELSTNRAEAVKSYLMTHEEIAANNTEIEAIGYGFQKPLTSNKTASGRAQNRRVDIVITPERENAATGAKPTTPAQPAPAAGQM